MFSWGVCNPGYMANHDCWEVNLLSSIHKVNKTLIYSIRKSMALTSRDVILSNEPKNKWWREVMSPFLMDWGAVNLVCWPSVWVNFPIVLSQAQSCPSEYTHQNLQQEHPKLYLNLWHWISVFFFPLTSLVTTALVILQFAYNSAKSGTEHPSWVFANSSSHP